MEVGRGHAGRVVEGLTPVRFHPTHSCAGRTATLPRQATHLKKRGAVFYWWHRWRHESDVLWVGFHQIHHSPQRIEAITSFYKHPLEMTVNSVLGSLIVYTLLGLDLKAGAIYTALTALGEFFYHTSVRTPRWIGYVFQRPEMHRIHHEYGRHRNNYGDIVWWDMSFGTYENPAEFESTCGFDPWREEQLLRMLVFKDVHRDGPTTAA